MKKLNKIGLTLLLVMTLVLASGFVLADSGTATITSPASGATIGNLVNATINVTVTMTNFTVGWNCTAYLKSASLSGNTTNILVAHLDQRSAGGANSTSYYINSTIGFEDANDYVINVTCRYLSNENATSYPGWSTNTGITIDNTVPTTPSSLSPATATVDADGTVEFSATVTGRETTSCILYFPERNPGQSSYTMTHSGDTCYRILTGISEQTYPNWYITASDETNTTNSATANLIVESKKSASKIPALLQEPGVSSTGGATLSVAGDFLTNELGPLQLWQWVAIIVVGSVVIVIYKRSKR